jgi:hypothetical protein
VNGTYPSRVAHETPEKAALAGFSNAAAARVVAQHESGDYAGVYVLTGQGSQQGDSVCILHRVGAQWHELTSGSGGWTWVALPDDDEEPLGVLALTGNLTRPTTVEVHLDGHTVTVTALERHWAAVFVGVDATSMERVVVRQLVEDDAPVE